MTNVLEKTKKEANQWYRYANETYSGCDMVASINIKIKDTKNSTANKTVYKFISQTVGEIQTVSYSIHMDKKPVRSIGEVGAKDYVMGPRTIAGSLVFSVFNKHFAKQLLEQINIEYEGSKNFLVDELPPFDIVITAANEYGFNSRLVIYGIRLLTEGQVMSINDIYTENTYQYFATDIEYLDDNRKYIYDPKNKFYVANTSEGKINKYSSPIISNPNMNRYVSIYDKDHKDYIERQNMLKQKVSLEVILKQPHRGNANGIATISLGLIASNTDGTLEIKRNGILFKTILLSHKSGENSLRVSQELSPGRYEVQYKEKVDNGTNGRESEIKTFYIKEYIEYDEIEKWSPSIEQITDTSIKIFSNSPLHSTVYATNSTSSHSAEITRRRATIKGLTPDTEYLIYTSESEGVGASIKKKVKTMDSHHKILFEFERFIYSNSSKLIDPNVSKYLEILEDTKKYLNETTGLTLALVKSKDFYIKELENLVNNNSSDEEKKEMNKKILMTGELIYISSSFNNRIIATINNFKVSAPEVKYNDTFEVLIKVPHGTSHIEIYLENGKISQFVEEIESSKLKTIDGINNCYRFLGKGGKLYSVSSYEDNVRSEKVKFYIPTNTEKELMLSKSLETISKEQIEYNEKTIKQKHSNLTQSEFERLLVNSIATISLPTVLPPVINNTDELEIETEIFNTSNSNKIEQYYIAVASLKELQKGDLIFKMSFTNKDKVILIDKRFSGLENGRAYAVWIEDNDGIQISQATTFINGHDDHVDIKNLENYDLFEMIKKIANQTVPNNATEIESIIEYDTSCNMINMSEKVIDSLVASNVRKNDTLRFLKYYKEFICNSSVLDKNMINEINFDNGVLEVKTSESYILIIHTIENGKKTILNMEIDGIATIDLNKYNSEFIYAYLTTSQFNKKSDLIFININEKYMEVI